MEDKLLVLRCRRGDGDALRRIYEKYKRDLLILAVALLKDVSAAEDVVHDVFVCFVQGLGKFRLTGSLKGYLTTCVANRARNASKAKHHQNVSLEEVQPVSSGLNNPQQSVVCNEELRQLSLATTELPYEQREVIMLHLQCGLSLTAIANLQGISVNTVKSRYRYGLDKLRTFFDEA
jgi:RNA polymerase sigma-70 factor (ECF subfamily)